MLKIVINSFCAQFGVNLSNYFFRNLSNVSAKSYSIVFETIDKPFDMCKGSCIELLLLRLNSC